jgi:hypothetical protein
MLATLIELVVLAVLSALLCVTALVFFEQLIATAVFAALACMIAVAVFGLWAFS